MIIRLMCIRSNYTSSARPWQAAMSSVPRTERKENAMTYRTASLLAERQEDSSDTVRARPHRHVNQEAVSHDTQEETLHLAVNAAAHGVLRNHNFAWLVSGQAISNLGDVVFSTTLFIWVFTFTHSAAAVSGML